MPKYENFQVKTSPIDVPKYNTKMDPPVYKAGGEVVRPKSSVGGKKWKAAYDQLNTTSHDSFHPVYGPQSDKRYHPYQKNDMMDVYRQQKGKEERQKEEEKQKTKEHKEKTPRDENKLSVQKDHKEHQKQETPRKDNYVNGPEHQRKDKDKPPKEAEKPKQEKTKRPTENVYNEKPAKQEKYAFFSICLKLINRFNVCCAFFPSHT